MDTGRHLSISDVLPISGGCSWLERSFSASRRCYCVKVCQVVAKQPLHKRHHFDTSWSIHMQEIGVQCLSRSDFPASCFHSFSQTADQPVNEVYRSLITVANYSAKQEIILCNVKIHYRVVLYVIYHFCCTTNSSLLFAVKINKLWSEDHVKSGSIVSIQTNFLCRPQHKAE